MEIEKPDSKPKDSDYEINLSEIFIDSTKYKEVTQEGTQGHKNQIPAKRWGHVFFTYKGDYYLLGGYLKRASKVTCALYKLEIVSKGKVVWTRINT